MKRFILILMTLFLITGCGFSKDTKEESYILNAEQEIKVNNIVDLLELQYDDFNFNSLTDQNKIQLLYNIARRLNINESGYDIITTDEGYLNKKNFEMIAREYFGEDASFKLVDIDCSICGKTDYYYDENEEVYHFNEDHLGHGYSAPIVEKKLEEVVKKDDIVSVKYKVLFSNYYDIGTPSDFFKSLYDSLDYKNAVASFEDYCWGDDVSFDCDYNKMFAEIDFNTYSYNFKLDGDNFYFVNYTIE